MSKILCPYHDDSNPSMEVYEERSFCFVCGVSVSNDELGVKGEVKRKIPTDIPRMVEYVQSLPLHRIRGLLLPADGVGYYILWPNVSYYKRRNFSGEPRYTNPRGVKQPLLVYPGNENLIVIEGELNAMTVKAIVGPPHTIMSPGAASEFIRYIDVYKTYKSITLVVDSDAPGLAYGLATKELLLKSGKHVNLVNVDVDYNDVLTQQGEGALKEQFESIYNP